MRFAIPSACDKRAPKKTYRPHTVIDFYYKTDRSNKLEMCSWNSSFHKHIFVPPLNVTTCSGYHNTVRDSRIPNIAIWCQPICMKHAFEEHDYLYNTVIVLHF